MRTGWVVFFAYVLGFSFIIGMFVLLSTVRGPGMSSDYVRLFFPLIALVFGVAVAFANLESQGRKSREAKAVVVAVASGSSPEFTLLLRPFATDGSILRLPSLSLLQLSRSDARLRPAETTFLAFVEEAIRDQFGHPVVAVAADEDNPGVGVARLGSDWQEQVSKLAHVARSIVIVCWSSPGVLWEVEQLLAPPLRSKVLFIIPPAEIPVARFGAARTSVAYAALSHELGRHGILIGPPSYDGIAFSEGSAVSATGWLDRDPLVLRKALERLHR